jgi:alkanesulfonate monooxygenase SsuD/methylene tetrahydromethanopterin reductase-like flavin-dependent oxidoreductase (luciferase family)
MSEEKPAKGTQCCVRVHSGGYVRGHQCGNAAKVMRNGIPYCGRHDPVAIRARKDRRNAKWEERWNAEAAAREKVKAARAERDRRADCFDGLLEALEYMLNSCPAIDPNGEEARQKAQAAITKAKGE